MSMIRGLLIVVLAVAPAAVLQAQGPCNVPDTPPRAALIRITPGEPESVVTGLAGAVPGGNRVVVINLQSGHFAWEIAQANGSFTARIFAPGGTSLLVKTAPAAIALPGLPPALGTIGETDFGLICVPGTILRVRFAGDDDTAFGGAGLALPNGNTLPAWSIRGNISRRAANPGESIEIVASVVMTDPAFRQQAGIPFSATVFWERIAGERGEVSTAFSGFGSAILTPTGLPVERKPALVVDPQQHPPFALSKVSDTRMEGPIRIEHILPLGLTPGYYRPWLVFGFPNLVGSTRPEVLMVRLRGGRAPVNNFNFPVAAPLPLIRVGEPATPRVPWILLADTADNGVRGAGALEDRNLYRHSNVIATQGESLTIPRVDAEGNAIAYRLEPFAPTIGIGDRGAPPLVPTVPFRFPSGRLLVRIRRPNGTTAVLGPVPFVQNRMRGVVDSEGLVVDPGTVHMADVYQLTTLDPRFEYRFAQEGRHVVEMEGEVEDIWGGVWGSKGTYEVDVGRTFSLDTAVLPGTPFETGDSPNAGVVVSPPAPAEVEVLIRFAPRSDTGRMIEHRIQGRANRFGYFQPSGNEFVFEEPGEYRIDIRASWSDARQGFWSGSRTWGGVVAPRDSPVTAHGRRGHDQLRGIGPQWFFRTQTGEPIGSSHMFTPFHSGDVMWMERDDAAVPIVTLHDPGGSYVDLLRSRRNPLPFQFDSRVAAGEAPLYSGRPDGYDVHLDPQGPDLSAYGYFSVQRPLVRVREGIMEDAGINGYWRFGTQYGQQIGAGPMGDLPGEIKFQYGGLVVRGPAVAEPAYAIYGSFFVLVPNQDREGGSRIFPPFQGNGGGPSGGPLLTLKGKPIDLFVHPTAVRPGSVLEVGDLFAFAGSVAPTLPAQVTYRVHFPDGRTTRVYSGRANRIGYYYRPEDRFVCEVPGRYEVEVGVSFDGVTSAGPVEEPFPTGDVLGSTGGRFSFYVVPKDSPALPVRMPAVSTLASHTTPVDLVAGGGEAPLDQVHLTTMMPGFLLESRALALSSGGSSAAYRYDPVVLARDSSMLDVRTGLLPANANPAAGELITITLFGVNAGQHRARIVTLRGRLLMDMPVLQ
jgi:hypothetical protein